MATWLKHLDEVITPLLDPSQWSGIPPFPCEAVCTALEIDGLTIQPKEGAWKTGDDLLDGLGDSPFLQRVELSPLTGALTLAVPSEDLEIFSAWGLKGTPFTDPDLRKAFFTYSLLQGARAVTEQATYGNISPKIGESKHPPEEGYVVDIALTAHEQTIWIRLICPEALHAQLIDHFSSQPPPREVLSELGLSLSIEAGRVTLTQEAWEGIRIGDFIILDQCSYNPASHKGTFLLSLQGSPLFQVKCKEEAIKVLDVADYYEEPLTEGGLNIVAQVARLHSTYNKLAELTAGSVLEMGVAPDRAVSLTIDETQVARGELLQVGDIVGVKILELT